ncbi:hypothetical protein CKAN_00014400 [Cinnamomum micranthum f. kanehirae]|uniref:CRM domain-containing protein n=1 Tax=Cinnamomum micranthum f. kanehirae TaxID=337451 RepID=A0A3S3LUQ2_9MAGN|nr:hypothetical protein CKAN_00014400 [Cinnamomum micranthum f. kanehirae]
MVTRVLASMALCKCLQQLKDLSFAPLISMPFVRSSGFHQISLSDVLCKVSDKKPVFGHPSDMGNFYVVGRLWIHTEQPMNLAEHAVLPAKNSENQVDVNDNGAVKMKRKKLKGKRAVVRWLKSFRYKKKRDYERMTAEEKILYKLRKARIKEARLMEALQKIEPNDLSVTTHDPEILTPEEHFYFLKMGQKCKNYVPIGRRGIFQGVILNMHLHWKKHQTVKVIVKTFTPEEVREIATELARLSGGIVLDIQEDDTIIMYRGKNYSQPPTEIMSPKMTLSKKKALDKSKFRDGLRAVRAFIPRLQQDMELLKAQAVRRKENKTDEAKEKGLVDIDDFAEAAGTQMDYSLNGLGEMTDRNDEVSEDDSSTESIALSDSEELSDIFETDLEEDADERAERPLYLDEFERFPTRNEEEPEDFEEHLRQISLESKKDGLPSGKDVDLSNLDEVDKLFLRAGTLMKKKRK